MKTRNPVSPMFPAAEILDRFGGISVVAGALGVSHSTVLRWTYPVDKGGTGGTIPSKRQHQLLRLAQERGTRLNPADFFASAA